MPARVSPQSVKAGETDVNLLCPPEPSARVPWPKDDRRFIIFGDAEEEFDWTRGFDRAKTATTAMLALPAANRTFVEAGCRPVYVVDWPVVDQRPSADAVNQMLADGECGIGTQLHPWVNPPFDEEVSQFNSFTGNLPTDLQERKLVALTEKIQAVCGVKPVIYRAGRYGLGRHSAALLARHGYRLDVSVRPTFSYADSGGPDYRRHPIWPWRISPGLYELPLTAGWVGWARGVRRGNVATSWRKWVARGLSALGGVNHVALTPEGMPLRHSLTLVETLLDEECALFSLSFHTPSVVPGHTPFVRDQADLANFWRWWDGMFTLFAKRGVLPIDGEGLIAGLDQAERNQGTGGGV